MLDGHCPLTVDRLDILKECQICDNQSHLHMDIWAQCCLRWRISSCTGWISKHVDVMPSHLPNKSLKIMPPLLIMCTTSQRSWNTNLAGEDLFTHLTSQKRNLYDWLDTSIWPCLGNVLLILAICRFTVAVCVCCSSVGEGTMYYIYLSLIQETPCTLISLLEFSVGCTS